MDYTTKPCRCCESFVVTRDPNRTLCFRCEQSRSQQLQVWVIVWLCLALFALAVTSKGGVVTEEFLDSIAQRESGNNPHAVGKAGEVTAYQLKPIAIRDVQQHFGWQASNYSLRTPSVARAYARAFCLMLEQRMSAVVGRYPSEAELYRAYRLGFRGWIRATQGHGGPAVFPTQIRPTPRTPGRESTGRLVAAPRRLASQQATGPGVLFRGERRP